MGLQLKPALRHRRLLDPAMQQVSGKAVWQSLIQESVSEQTQQQKSMNERLVDIEKRLQASDPDSALSDTATGSGSHHKLKISCNVATQPRSNLNLYPFWLFQRISCPRFTGGLQRPSTPPALCGAVSMGETTDIAAVAELQKRDLKPEDYDVLANLPQTLGTVPSALRCIRAYVSAALPRRLASGGQCTICLECCIPSESECIQLACACEFHVHCISDHLAESNQCPVSQLQNGGRCATKRQTRQTFRQRRRPKMPQARSTCLQNSLEDMVARMAASLAKAEAAATAAQKASTKAMAAAAVFAEAAAVSSAAAEGFAQQIATCAEPVAEADAGDRSRSPRRNPMSITERAIPTRLWLDRGLME